MANENSNKIKLLKLWELLKAESDEDRPLSTTVLIGRLKEMGISCDRRTLYADINTLKSFGYEIEKTRVGHACGYYVPERSFSVPELRILLDAVQAASFVTEKKTELLIEKIAALGGSYRAELMRKNCSSSNLAKHKNEHVLYSLSEIEDAITAGKKVSFCYYQHSVEGVLTVRNDGERYVVNPLATVFRDDNSYLLAYQTGKRFVKSYRIDRMREVKVEKQNITDREFAAKFDVRKFRMEAFQMFNGKPEKVMLVAEEELVNVIVDKFGEDVNIQRREDGKIVVTEEVCISPIFFGWCLSFGKKLKLVGPKSVRNEFAAYIKETLSD